MFRSDENRPMGVQFAGRVAFLSGLALFLFAAVFFRLWQVQVLSGAEYRAQSEDNQVRTIPIRAGRGEILDTKGRILVANRSAVSLQVRPDELPKNNEVANDELRRLGRVAEIPYPKIKREIHDQLKLLPANPVTLASDVPHDLVFYLEERQDQFPGVTAGEVSVRRYPRGDMAAQLFGFVREVDAKQLKDPLYEDLDPGDQIGADGLELQYDRYLRGRNGAYRVKVDAFGNPERQQLAEVQPETGDNLVLSIDTKVQKAGEAAMAAVGLPGGFVAMRVKDGAIVAMGSYPTFDPDVFTPPVDTKSYAALQDDPAMPLFNRAIAGLYPTGSTFKPITGIAAIADGAIGATETYYDDGSFDLGAGNEVTNADTGGAGYGALTMETALLHSSNVFFAEMGSRLENETDEGLQKWASDLGIGQSTGIDLPGEAAGLLPTPEWRNDLYSQDLTDRKWSVGDNINLAIGQGDLQADPLQMAVAYAAIANGGTIVRPHLAESIEDARGVAVSEFDPAPRRKLDIPVDARQAVLAGMHDAATAAGGTSVEVFGDFPIEVAGKTGTAQRPPNGLQSWYASVAPYGDPKYVVVTTVENGGYGAETAAPVAKAIYQALFEKELKGTDGGLDDPFSQPLDAAEAPVTAEAAG